MNKTLFLNQNSVKSSGMKTKLQINSILIGCIILFSIPSFLAFAQSDAEISFILKHANQFFDAKRYAESISIYDEVLEIDPNNVIALGKKGEAYARLGNFDDALFYFDQVLELNPTQSDSSRNPYFDLALEIDPNHINALLKKADSLLKEESFEEAISYYDKVLEIDQESITALVNKARTLEKLGNFEEAMINFEKTLKIDPNNPVALARKGDEFAKLGNFKEAMIYYDKVLQIKPRLSDASREPYYEKVLEIEPNHLIALYYKGLKLSFYDNLLENAILFFDQILEIDPIHVDALTQKGESLIRLDRFKEGMIYFDKSLALEPNNLDVLAKKGNALVKIGNFDEGMTYFDKVLETDPNHVDTLYKKADAFRSNQQYGDSFSYFYKVLEIEPTHNLARNKIKITTNALKLIPLDGFMEAKIHDINGYLVGHMVIPHLLILNHDLVENMVNDWPVSKIVTRNGTDYEVHQFTRVRDVGYNGGIWGGATHYGIHPPFGTELWLVYTNYWMFFPSKGDTISYIYTVFTPIE